ncbi:MAG: hypothetical protein E6J76_15590, partial [Deltaproteobacteria bacterium]
MAHGAPGPRGRRRGGQRVRPPLGRTRVRERPPGPPFLHRRGRARASLRSQRRPRRGERPARYSADGCGGAARGARQLARGVPRPRRPVRAGRRDCPPERRAGAAAPRARLRRVTTSAPPRVIALALVLAGGCRPTCTPPPGDARPNVVLVTVDTLRADHLGCYGSPVVRTPHLDRLAAEGTLFERCYALTHVTVPSHLTILTSL